MHYVLHPATLRRVLIVPLFMLAAALSAGVVFAHPVEQGTLSAPPLTVTPTECATGWSHVPSPSTGIRQNSLKDIVVISDNDIWAVGYYRNSSQLLQSLILHWDGSQWTIVTSPNVGSAHTMLHGVSAVSATDIWAVGTSVVGTSYQTVTMHWNGSQWSLVANFSSGQFHDVTAISANDVWAVGSNNGALTVHWNGTNWTQVPTPSPGVSYLMGVTASATDDVWAVGTYTIGQDSQTLTMHWDGSQWTVVPSPNPGNQGNDRLNDVYAVSPNDVWAVGDFGLGSDAATLTLHWDGTTWSHIPSPSVGSEGSHLSGVVALDHNNVWAVGSYGRGAQTLALRWNGTNWTVSDTPNPGASSNYLEAIAALSTNELWAVGNLDQNMTLVERYTESCVTPTLPPTNTATPTPQPPTFTPTSTSTSVMPTPTCSPAWEIVSSPNITTSNVLHSVAIVSQNDIWAVGVYNDGARAYTLIEHWDGSSWSIVPSPVVGDGNSILNAVTAISTTDVWAAGSYTEAGAGRTLALHWDGSAWSHVPTPNANGPGGTFTALAAIGPSDVWAVGSVGSSPSYTLIQHWDGTQWSIVPSPNSGQTINELYGVTAVSSTDVWAVGVADPEGPPETLTLHWDGQSWTVIPSPNAGSNGNVLWGVSAVSSDDVWAVGGYGINPGGTSALIQHWNGTAWSLAPGAVNEESPVLYAVAAVSATEVWAVGWSSEESLSRTLIERWDGNQWNTISSPNGGTSNNALYGVAAEPGANAWAVGVHTSLNTASTLVERYIDLCATPTPTTPPTISATNTPIPTASPSRTPTIAITTTTPPNPSPTLTLTPTLQPTCEGTWQTYDMHPDGAYAQAVDATTSGDVWSVGFVVGPIFLPNAERWDGNEWERMLALDWSSPGGTYYDVTAISPNDVWAAGVELTRSFDRWPEVAHWDGTSWTRFEFPSPDLASGFYGIDSVDANDIWTVGTHQEAGMNTPLIYHYDGVLWQRVSSPQITSMAGLYSVTALSANDVWAVGYTNNSGIYASLILHWDGSAWSVVASPPSVGALYSIDALSPDDIWAVGDSGILHWDGAAWSIVPSPSGARAVSALASDDVWAVSSDAVLHWDGTEWRVVFDPPADLTDVVAIAPGDVWVVGNASGTGNISFHYTDQQFSDVSRNNTFYSQVQCLACRGIISGYADGTFRPNNEVTRGQLSKIVSNSAGFSEDPGEQRFEDVPPSNTFYEWVQRLAARGHIGGYECGGVGEPCISGKPYFRPNANATRGQISKIVSNAAGYADPPGEQIFEDVPPPHTFYEWIQRLASRNIMSGYPCGGLGEPCLSGRPYFRPQNNATRGQTSKIVANTFFADCNP